MSTGLRIGLTSALLSVCAAAVWWSGTRRAASPPGALTPTRDNTPRAPAVLSVARDATPSVRHDVDRPAIGREADPLRTAAGVVPAQPVGTFRERQARWAPRPRWSHRALRLRVRPAQHARATHPGGASSATEQPVTETEAREALKLVGADAEADAYWVRAINDPNLAPKARRDLIEDLNEEGFSDPKNLTAADLPLIEARLALIEGLGPDAMDQTNADAFAEAYKDLIEMRARLVGE